MYVCMYVCMYVMYVIYVGRYVCLSVCLSVCMYVCMYVCIHMDTSTRVKRVVIVSAVSGSSRTYRIRALVRFGRIFSRFGPFFLIESLWPLFSNRFGCKVDIPSFSDSPRCPVLGFSRCLAVGSRVLVLGSWSLVWGSSLVLGSGFLVLAAGFVPGSWFMVLGSWFLVWGSRLFFVPGSRSLVLGSWSWTKAAITSTHACKAITAAIDAHR